jgi:oligopeptide transport system ATP-binding protein
MTTPPFTTPNSSTLLEASNLSVQFATRDGAVRAVSNIDLHLNPGEALAIVGESGSGKSQMLLSILGLSARNARVTGSARFKGEELIGAAELRLNEIRGADIGFVFQDPMTSLNPYLTIGLQLTEPLRIHRNADRASATSQAIEMLKSVHINEPAQRMNQYPHQLSGGMRQRVAIAMALICRPAILIADEPTTALDVTVQAQVLSLLREIREQFGTALILVTHDLGVIAELADRVNVMYAGRIVETGPIDDIFYKYRHPYTEALQGSIPKLTEIRPTRLLAIPGNPPNPSHLPPGCAFHPRCHYRLECCDKSVPPLEAVTADHRKACFYEGPLNMNTDANADATVHAKPETAPEPSL